MTNIIELKKPPTGPNIGKQINKKEIHISQVWPKRYYILNLKFWNALPSPPQIPEEWVGNLWIFNALIYTHTCIHTIISISGTGTGPEP